MKPSLNGGSACAGLGSLEPDAAHRTAGRWHHRGHGPWCAVPTVGRTPWRLRSNLQRHRALWSGGFRRTPSSAWHGPGIETLPALLACAISRRRLPCPLGAGGALAIVHVGDELVPVFVARPAPRLRRRADVRAAVETFLSACGRHVIDRACQHLAAAAPRPGSDGHRTPGPLALRDERLARGAAAASRLHQPGLFDRRAEFASAAGQNPRHRLPSTLRQAQGRPSSIEGQLAQGGKLAPTQTKVESSIALLLFITAEGGDA